MASLGAGGQSSRDGLVSRSQLDCSMCTLSIASNGKTVTCLMVRTAQLASMAQAPWLFLAIQHYEATTGNGDCAADCRQHQDTVVMAPTPRHQARLCDRAPAVLSANAASTSAYSTTGCLRSWTYCKPLLPTVLTIAQHDVSVQFGAAKAHQPLPTPCIAAVWLATTGSGRGGASFWAGSDQHNGITQAARMQRGCNGGRTCNHALQYPRKCCASPVGTALYEMLVPGTCGTTCTHILALTGCLQHCT
jgi:hypothetical protein